MLFILFPWLYFIAVDDEGFADINFVYWVRIDKPFVDTITIAVGNAKYALIFGAEKPSLFFGLILLIWAVKHNVATAKNILNFPVPSARKTDNAEPKLFDFLCKKRKILLQCRLAARIGHSIYSKSLFGVAYDFKQLVKT